MGRHFSLNLSTYINVVTKSYKKSYDLFFKSKGNTYAKFRYEEDAEKAVQDLNNRWFNGKAIYAELSPVTDFYEASCQFQASDCPRGGFCNFLHLKSISRSLRNRLFSKRRRFIHRK